MTPDAEELEELRSRLRQMTMRAEDAESRLTFIEHDRAAYHEAAVHAQAQADAAHERVRELEDLLKLERQLFFEAQRLQELQQRKPRQGEDTNA